MVLQLQIQNSFVEKCNPAPAEKAILDSRCAASVSMICNVCGRVLIEVTYRALDMFHSSSQAIRAKAARFQAGPGADRHRGERAERSSLPALRQRGRGEQSGAWSWARTCLPSAFWLAGGRGLSDHSDGRENCPTGERLRAFALTYAVCADLRSHASHKGQRESRQVRERPHTFPVDLVFQARCSLAFSVLSFR